MPGLDAMTPPSHPFGAAAAPTPPEAIAPRILDEAAAWLVQLHASQVTDQERAAWQQWRQSSAQHASAWQRAELLMNKLGSLPPQLAMPTLNRADVHTKARTAHGTSRRATLKNLAVLLAAAPASWLAWQMTPWQEWIADHTTALGERKDITLADATRLTLGTGTTVDVRYDAQQRLIVLHSGQILVQSGRDPAQRPLLVQTGQGRLRAIGTRFSVRQLQDTGHEAGQTEGRTHLAVLEGAVEIAPRDTATRLVLTAGQQTSFSAQTIATAEAADDSAAAWTQGMLMADAMRLDALAVELARYRKLAFRIHPRVAGLAVSGAFPVNDAQRTLGMLQASHALQVSWERRSWGHDLVTLSPR